MSGSVVIDCIVMPRSLLLACSPFTAPLSCLCCPQDLTQRYNVDSYMAKHALPRLRQFRREPSRSSSSQSHVWWHPTVRLHCSEMCGSHVCPSVPGLLGH